jgi:hypothetical protein
VAAGNSQRLVVETLMTNPDCRARKFRKKP